jgi:AcrR family transcriptional regulator
VKGGHVVESGRGRGEQTREAILEAAEAAFAERGFDGARVDAIAEASGYNKTLIFRYYGDKVGLYAATLRRLYQQASELQAALLMPLLGDADIMADASRFRAFLTKALEAFYDFMVEHPHLMRIILWEHAGGWQSYAKVAAVFDAPGLTRLEERFQGAQTAGILRANGDTFVLLLLAEQICWSLPTALPFYQLTLPERTFTSVESRKRVRDQVIAFIVAGLLTDQQIDDNSSDNSAKRQPPSEEKFNER